MSFLSPLLPAISQCSTRAISTAVAAAICFVFLVCLVVYRLLLSPLAGFPGSKIVASTHFYEFYYDWWCHGKYIYEIEKMHEKYGGFVNED